MAGQVQDRSNTVEVRFAASWPAITISLQQKITVASTSPTYFDGFPARAALHRFQRMSERRFMA